MTQTEFDDKWIAEIGWNPGVHQDILKRRDARTEFREDVTKLIAAEREACAKLAEGLFPQTNGPGWLSQDGKRIIAHEVAVAIRTRGKE